MLLIPSEASILSKYSIYFDRIDASEGINVNITSVSKECDICH